MVAQQQQQQQKGGTKSLCTLTYAHTVCPTVYNWVCLQQQG